MAKEKVNIYITGFFILILGISIAGCEKEITIDIPDAETKLVIEGVIEADGVSKIPPVVMLTKSTGYFEPTSIDVLENLFVHDAIVSITVDNVVYPLEELCLNDLDSTFAVIAADFLGIPLNQLGGFNYCIYTVPIGNLIADNYLHGEIGKTYHLTVVSEGATYSSVTTIPELIPLDSVWFKTQDSDTLGFAWARLSDPPQIGNAYRWRARRINQNMDGDTKDPAFIPPSGSSFEDKFFNGASFEFAYDRGHVENDDPGDIPHYFKKNDSIAIKFCTIDMDVYRFLRIYEVEASSNGSPFASPTTIPTNIEGGGLGLWAGYGATYDTIIGY
jgi:hypothetical protein